MPGFLRGTGSGWVTAEYGMLPRSTNTRTEREAARGKQSGRSMEIQRLIGRALRSVTNLDLLGERTLHRRLRRHQGGRRHAHGVDHRLVRCAGAGAATRSSTDGRRRRRCRCPASSPPSASASSARKRVLDLDYVEDSSAEVDFNVVMTGDGRFVEVQGTAEGEAFDRAMMDRLVDLGARRHPRAQRRPARCRS